MLTVTSEMHSHYSGLSYLLPSAFRQIRPKCSEGRDGNKTSSWRQGLLSAYHSMKSKTSLIYGTPSAAEGQNFEHASWVASNERIIPLKGIHVQHHMRASKYMSSFQVYNASYCGKHAVGH